MGIKSQFNELQVPGWEVMLVGTRADKLYTDDERRRKGRNILTTLIHEQKKRIQSYKEEIQQLS